ncbi:MAG: hypothetical protein QUS08_04120 [Methanothrix sp.]|nr:hypothetical protein [Methanothrix sp.]
MRLIYPIVALLLLTGLGSSQLSPDKERFDVVLHPGSVEERTLKVTNTGDTQITKISSTQVSGSIKEFVLLDMPEEEPLQPTDSAEVAIYFVVPPETDPGLYTGFIYLLDSTPPSMPVRVDFNLNVVGEESYGLSMTINDAKAASTFAKAEETAEFDIAIKNLGSFRDVASIDSSPIPEGWTVLLQDGEEEHLLPYSLPLDPGVTHRMKLQIQTTEPGEGGELMITATSLGNRSKNDTVNATVEFGMAVRGYSVNIEVPDRMVVNKTYRGTFEIMLDVKERVLVGIASPDALMVIPVAQVVEVTPERPGVANFSMLASEPGEHPLIFNLVDSNGIPMPRETASVRVTLPEGVAVLTGDDLVHSAVASLCAPENRTLPVITASHGMLSERSIERLQGFSRVVILGNQSVVSYEAERALEGIDVKRLQGEGICEESWMFLEEMWQNGTSEMVLSSSRPVDLFRAYQIAKKRGLPLVVCDGGATEHLMSVIGEMRGRRVALSRVLAVGDVAEISAALEEAGVLVEEVTE